MFEMVKPLQVNATGKRPHAVPVIGIFQASDHKPMQKTFYIAHFHTDLLFLKETHETTIHTNYKISNSLPMPFPFYNHFKVNLG